MSAEFPEDNDYRKRLLACVYNLAILELALKKYDHLKTPPNGEPKLDDHYLAIARHIKSAEAMEKIDALGNQVNASRYAQAAWIMSRCILLAEADSDLSDGRRKDVTDKYADRTLQLLQLAVDKELDTEGLSADKRFEPLRKLRPNAVENLRRSSAVE